MSGAGNAPGAFGAVIDWEGIIRHALARIFLRRAHVEQQPLPIAQMCAYVVAVDTRRRIAGRRGIVDRPETWHLFRERPAFGEPFLAPAIEQLELWVPGHCEGPISVAAKLNGIAIDQDGCLRSDAQAAEQLRHGRWRDEVAVGSVPAGRLPVEPQRARDVSLAIDLVIV